MQSDEDEKVVEDYTVQLNKENPNEVTEDGKVHITEAKRRYKIAREIEETTVFKSLKKTAEDHNISIMLDAIVDRYLENTSAADLANFTVSDELIRVALCQTIYLISKEENGLVIDTSGAVDKKLTQEQQAQMNR